MKTVKGKLLYEAFADVDPMLIHMAETRTFPRHTLQKTLRTAAMVLLAAGIGLFAWNGIPDQASEITPEPISEVPAELPSSSESISDEEILELIKVSEIACNTAPQNPFLFASPQELESDQLYALFLAWSDLEDIKSYYRKDLKSYCFPEQLIVDVLNRHLKNYHFEIEKAANEYLKYDPESNAILDPLACGKGSGARRLVMQERTNLGASLHCVVGYYFEDGDMGEFYRELLQVVTYELFVEDGRIYFQSAQEQPLAGWCEAKAEKIIYQDLAGNEETFTYAYPTFLLDSEDALAMNDEMKSLAETYVAEMEEQKASQCSLIHQQVFYDAAIHGDIISIVMKVRAGDYTEYDTFNLNQKTGNRVSGEEMLLTAGLTETEFGTITKEVVKEAFLEQNGDRKTLEGLNQEGYQEQYALTLTENSFDAAMPMFFDEDGKLCVVAQMFPMAGPACYEDVFVVQ